MSQSWRPTASLETLQKRAELLAQIRSFFYARNLMEVEVPLIATHAVLDVHIDSIPVEVSEDKDEICFLSSSPEFFMKRLLANGSGSIFYLGKAFRLGDKGKKHNPEFTMLEWYRLGWDEHRLIDELADLLCAVGVEKKMSKISYGELFEKHLSINPHTADEASLKKLVQQNIEITIDDLNINDCLDLLFSHYIEPKLQGLVCVYDYPASQAALAKTAVNEDGIEVARRFEFFLEGMELANGYFELIDAVEQRARFEKDLFFAEVGYLFGFIGRF